MLPELTKEHLKWIALSVTNVRDRERFIAEVVRMLSDWIGSGRRSDPVSG